MPEQKQDDEGLIEPGLIVSSVKGLAGLIPGIPQEGAKHLGNVVYHAALFADKVDDSLIDTSGIE
jgi:hypothetical protein